MNRNVNEGNLEARRGDHLRFPLPPFTPAVTVFDVGRRRALNEQARSADDSTVASYRQTVLTAFQEVEDNLAVLRMLEQEAGVQAEAVQAAERSLALSNTRYEGGVTSYLESHYRPECRALE